MGPDRPNFKSYSHITALQPVGIIPGPFRPTFGLPGQPAGQPAGQLAGQLVGQLAGQQAGPTCTPTHDGRNKKTDKIAVTHGSFIGRQFYRIRPYKIDIAMWCFRS